MKYKLIISYEYIEDTQKQYDELIEYGYLPDEAENKLNLIYMNWLLKLVTVQTIPFGIIIQKLLMWRK